MPLPHAFTSNKAIPHGYCKAIAAEASEWSSQRAQIPLFGASGQPTVMTKGPCYTVLVSQLTRKHNPYHRLRSLRLCTLLPPGTHAADTNLPGYSTGALRLVLPMSNSMLPTPRGYASIFYAVQMEELRAKYRFPCTNISLA